MLIKNAFIVRFFKKDIIDERTPTVFNCQDSGHIDLVINTDDRVRLEEFAERPDLPVVLTPAYIKAEHQTPMFARISLSYSQPLDMVHFSLTDPSKTHPSIMSTSIDTFRRLVRRLND
jgi:hypothetical protein